MNAKATLFDVLKLTILKYTFLFLAIFAPALLTGQAYFTVKNAPAKAKKAYDSGREAMQAGDIAGAIRYYRKAVEIEPTFVDAWLYLGGAHLQSQHWADAETAFEKAITLAPDYDARALMTCSEAEWYQEKYAEAAAHAQAYLLSNPKNENAAREARRMAENAAFAAEAVQHPVPFNPQPLKGAVNTPDDEYFPLLSANGKTLIFTRNDGKTDENFYEATLDDEGVWGEVIPLEGVNTAMNEGAQAMAADGSWIACTACNRRDDGSQGGCDLYWSQSKNGIWTPLKPFSAVINSPSWESQPTISADGKSIVFTSDRPGGQGGLDLWITIREKGRWTPPVNLGAKVNSAGNDHLPFLHPDGQTLYFTSDGRPGMGGDDLYLCRRQPDGTWGTPENLGFPINTRENEGNLTLSLDGKIAFFAAKRPGSNGVDIYQFDVPASIRPQAATYAQARVMDAVRHVPLQAQIEISDLSTGKIWFEGPTRPDGTFLVCLPAGRDYALAVTKEKYLFHSAHFNLSDSATFYQPFELKVDLQPLADHSAGQSKPVVLRNVFFESGSADLLPASHVELSRLAQLLIETPTLRIAINGHTDNVGDPERNLRLSQQRAEAVRQYLLQNGVADQRIQAKGFGEKIPVATNDTPAGRAENRRTEFTIIP